MDRMGNIMERYGYIRVSSKDQKEDRQLLAMEELKIKKKNVFIDKQTGKNFNRPAYKKLMKTVRKGDIIYILSIDRLGRNYEEILQQWRIITKDKKVDIVVLDMPLLDTRVKEKGLTGVFISDLVLQILSYVAETERVNIKKRQAEGIAAARKKGIHLGRPKKDVTPEFIHVYSSWKKGILSGRKAAGILNISPTTFYSWVERESLRKKR